MQKPMLETLGDTAKLPPELDILRQKISPELIQAMRKANDFVSLTNCWKQLDEVLNLPSFDNNQGQELLYLLNLISRTFQNPYHACGISVKTIDQKRMMPQVVQLGIPQEFLYQSVRIGDIKSVEIITGNAHHEHLQNVEPHSLLSGFRWANEQFRSLHKEKEQDYEKLRDFANRIKTEVLLQHIAARMHEKEFVLKIEELGLIKDELINNLMLWKCIVEDPDCILYEKINEFCDKYGDHEISSELFKQFKAIILDPQLQQKDFEERAKNRTSFLDIINPESGWFFICIKAIRAPITFRKFIEHVLNYMCDRVPNYLTNPNTRDSL